MTLIGALAIAVYLNTLGSGYIFDDEFQIRDNPVVTQGVDIVRILASPLVPGDLYRPFTILTFAVSHALAPESTVCLHAVNILLHAVVTMLVFLLAIQLLESSRIAMLAAILFAVHPIHTEAVAGLVGRAELLAALFGLVTLLCVGAADAATNRPRQLMWIALSLASVLLAMLSKESALTVVALVPLYRIARRGESWIAGLRHELTSLDWVPYALCAAVFLGLRFSVVGAVSPPEPIQPLNNVLAFVPTVDRIRSAVGVLWDYFALLNFPLILSADYSYDQVPVVATWFSARFVAGVLMVIAGFAVALFHRRSGVRFAVALSLVTLAITSNVFFPIGTVKAERLLYLPSVGWAVLVAYALDRLLSTSEYRRVAVLVAGVAVFCFAIRTSLRNYDWQDSATLFETLVVTAPNSAKAHYNIATVLQARHEDAYAAPEFRRSLSLYSWPEGAFGIGVAYHRHGKVEEAERWYRTALKIRPGFVSAYINLGQMFLVHQRFADAERACREGLRYRPTNANLLKGLGASLIAKGEQEKGIAILRRARLLDRKDQELREYLDSVELVAATSRATSEATP